MYTIFLKAKTTMLFAKAVTLVEAKQIVNDEFKNKPGYFYASIYIPEDDITIERLRSTSWKTKP